MNSDAFKDRLKTIMGEESNRSFAEKCGISEGTLRRYLRGDTTPDLDTLHAIAGVGGCTLAWLAAGQGSMRPGEGAEAPALTPLHLDDYMVLPVYVTGGAGDPYELIPADPIEEVFIPKSFYSPAIVPVKVKGRSMERTLRDGAVVGVDRADKEVINGELYAVWLPYQGTVIKRLYLDNKKILLQSDNEEFRSRDVEVNISDVDEHFVQGRVKWVVQML